MLMNMQIGGNYKLINAKIWAHELYMKKKNKVLIFFSTVDR